VREAAKDLDPEKRELGDSMQGMALEGALIQRVQG